MSFNNQIKLHFGNLIAPKMIWSAGKGNSEPKSSVKKETLTVENTSFINSLQNRRSWVLETKSPDIPMWLDWHQMLARNDSWPSLRYDWHVLLEIVNNGNRWWFERYGKIKNARRKRVCGWKKESRIVKLCWEKDKRCQRLCWLNYWRSKIMGRIKGVRDEGLCGRKSLRHQRHRAFG